MTQLTAQQLADIQARANAASRGPWGLSEDYSDVLGPDGSHLASHWLEADGQFIAHARTDIPALLAEIHRLTAQRKYLIAQLAKRDAETGRGDQALREFLAGEPAEETHTVADDAPTPA